MKGPMLYYFSKDPCLNFNMSLYEEFSQFVLHIMVGQNPRKSNTEK